MLKKLCFLFVLASAFQLSGQGNGLDSNYHYLILQSKGNQKYSIAFRENKKIEVHNKQGEYFKGRLLIINDSTIEIVDHSTPEKDTILIAEISKIRYVGLANKLIAYPSILAGGGFLLLGGGIYTASGNYDPIGKAVGTAIMVISTPFIALSAILFHGKSYKISKHDIKVYHSKIRNLKRKQSKHFYPNT